MEYSADHPGLFKYAIIRSRFYTPAAIDINEPFQINKNIRSFTMFLGLLFFWNNKAHDLRIYLFLWSLLSSILHSILYFSNKSLALVCKVSLRRTEFSLIVLVSGKKLPNIYIYIYAFRLKMVLKLGRNT